VLQVDSRVADQVKRSYHPRNQVLVLVLRDHHRLLVQDRVLGQDRVPELGLHRSQDRVLGQDRVPEQDRGMDPVLNQNREQVLDQELVLDLVLDLHQRQAPCSDPVRD
jgi:hypothetical protein